MQKTSRSAWYSSTVYLYFYLRVYGGLFLALTWLAMSSAQAQSTYTLGTTALLVGPAAGSNSVVLGVTPTNATWAATANGTWLHLSPANQGGTGGTNVVFSYDANPGATRANTLSIAGQTLTVTQAGSTYVSAQPLTTLVSSGLNYPGGLAVDGAGNVYIADTDNNAIKKWTATNNTVTTLVSSGLINPWSVAVDATGNVYITSVANMLQEWTVANSSLTILAGGSVGYGVAVDGAGDVFFPNVTYGSIDIWTPAAPIDNRFFWPLLTEPVGVAVDGAGNTYAGCYDNTVRKRTTLFSTAILISSGLNLPGSLAADGAGNVYIADCGNSAIKKWTAANNSVTTVVSSTSSGGVAVDGAGNDYISDADYSTVKELAYAFVDPTPKLESVGAGSDVLPTVLPTTQNLLAPFAPTSDQSWLSISGITNGMVSFSFTANTFPSNRTAHIILLRQTIPVTQGSPTYSLGAASFLAGPTAGTNSVVLVVTPAIGTWTATANVAWLHVSPASQSGTGSTNVIFSYDANTGATRSGTLSIADQTLTVTQAGATYVAAGPLTTLVASNMSYPTGLTVDGGGNVYIADTGANAIKKWALANNTESTLISSGLNEPYGVAVDGTGNVYISGGDNTIKKWAVANSNITTLVSGLNSPQGLAMDAVGNLYIADTHNSAIKKWTAANSNVTTLVASGLSQPEAVAVDAAGNVYIADTFNSAIKEWTAVNSNVTTLVFSGLSDPCGVAVDGSGNVYISDTYHSAIKKWTAANNNVTALISSGLSYPGGAAVDGTGNVYIADTDNAAIKELPYAFVDPTPKLENLISGNDSLPAVLPTTENLLAPFAPSTNQTWLAINGISNGVVNFGFTASSSNRTGNIILFGQNIPVTQETFTFSLGTNALVEGSSAGSDSVVLTVIPPSATWTATANAVWLHLSVANQRGTGCTNVVFTYDANSGPPRIGNLTVAGETLTVTQGGCTITLGTTALLVPPAAGSNSVVLAVTPVTGTWTATTNVAWLHLTPANQRGTGCGNVVFGCDANAGMTRSGALIIGGQTLTITQAGSSYVAAAPLTTLVSSGLEYPEGVAVDAVGDVYIADTLHNAIKEWKPTNNTVTTLVSSGLDDPYGLTVDIEGNVYIADTYDQAIKEWTEASGNVTTLVSSGLNYPYGVGVDGAGNVYIADTDNSVIKKWTPTNSSVNPLVSSGLSFPRQVGVDGAGNLYIVDSGNQAIKKWTTANSNITTLVSYGLHNPGGVAVDGSGNVYIVDGANQGIKKWTVASNTVTTLVLAGLNSPDGVAVDGADNVYIADSGNFAIKELPYAFVDPTPKLESLVGGNDALPVVLPVTENLLAPFAPTSDQSWLTISGITNGVVSFAFTTNGGPTRTAHITLLGQSIPVTQTGIAPPTVIAAPRGATLASGNNGTLTVNASGGGQLSYQWQVNGSNIAGATSSLLNLGLLQLTNAGLYSVTISNGGGAVTSGVAVLNVAPQMTAQLSNRNVALSWPGPFVLQAAGKVEGPYVDVAAAGSPYLESTTNNGQQFYRVRSAPFLLSGTNLQSGGFSLGGPGIPGCNFIVEASTNLVNWQPLQTNPSPFTFIDTNAANYPMRFYRAVLAH